MKKFITAIALVCILLTLFTVIASAEVGVSADKKGVAEGEQIVITVTADTGVNDLMALQYNFFYDETLFVFDKMESDVFDTAVPSNGELHLVKMNISGYPPQLFDVPQGVIAKLYFTAIVDSAPEADYFSIALQRIVTYDGAMKDVTADPAYAVLGIGTDAVSVLIHNHTYASTPTQGTDTHYYECSCGTITGETPHNYSDGCDTTCNTCGAVRSVAGHSYSNACDAYCDICGATRTPAAHVYDNACDADCNVCGETRTPAAHVYDNACDADCNVCGATRTPAAHVYDNACDADCNVCGATRTPAAHVYDNACDAECNVCGESRNIEHAYTVLKKDATQHWYACEICSAKKQDSVEAHKGGTATCTEKAKCSVCNEVYGTVNSNNHNFASTLTQGEDSHYYTCSRCSEKKEEAKHVFANWSANNDGTHTGTCTCGKTATANCEGGTATCVDKAVCSICNTAYGSVKADNHKSDDVKYVANGDGTHRKQHACCDAVIVAAEACAGGTASCTDKAVCESCGATYGEVAAHTGGEANCTEQAVCSACGTPYGELAPENHDFSGDWLTDEEGHWHVCSRCDAKDEVIAHTYSDGLCECGAEKPANIALIVTLITVGVLTLGGGGVALWYFHRKKKK